MRAIKLMLVSGAVVFGLSLICIALSVTFFNPNHYKGTLERWIHAQTGRAFTLHGELQLQLFPTVALSAAQFELDDLPRFGVEPLLQARRLAVQLRWWPLLRGRLSVDQLLLEGVRVHVSRNAAGENNWQVFLQQLTRQTGDPRTDARWSLQFEALQRLILRDATLRFDDRAAAATYEAHHIQLQVNDIRLQQTFAMQGAASVVYNADWQSDWRWNGNIMLDVARQRYAVDTLRINMQLKDRERSTVAVPIEFTVAHAELDRYLQAATADGVALNIAGAQLAATVAAHAQRDGRDLAAQWQLTAQLRLNPLNLRAWSEHIGRPLPQTRAREALNALSAHGNLQANMNAVTLTIDTLTLDDTAISGQLRVEFAPSLITFGLHADQLNIDSYLSPLAPNASASTPALPLAWLRELNARGSLDIDRAQWQGTHLQQLVLQVEDE